MAFLKIWIFLIVFCTLPTENPITPWFAATNQIELSSKPSASPNFIELTLNLPQSFNGEVAILLSSEKTVYQAYHEFPAGVQIIQFPRQPHHNGPYLLVLYDFDRQELKTSKIKQPD